MVAETGCDAVMIGRAAIGNPWIFREVVGSPAPTTSERFALIRRHIELIRNYDNEKGTIAQIRKFLPKYLKGYRGCKELFVKLCATNKVEEALDRINDFEHLYKDRN
jgi:tRNA-dihydrouridine synthase